MQPSWAWALKLIELRSMSCHNIVISYHVRSDLRSYRITLSCYFIWLARGTELREPAALLGADRRDFKARGLYKKSGCDTLQYGLSNMIQYGNIYIYIYTHIYIYIYIYTHIHIRISLSLSLSLYIYIYTYTYTHTYTLYIHLSLSIYIYIYIYTHIYTYTYTYIYIYIERERVIIVFRSLLLEALGVLHLRLGVQDREFNEYMCLDYIYIYRERER